MNDTVYATDAIVREQLPVPVVKAPTPKEEVPLSKWDFAYVTIPDSSDLFISVNGVEVSYEEYVIYINHLYDTLEGDALEAADIDFVSWVREKLYTLGVGVYRTYENYGCWEIFRFQNLNNTKKDIVVNISFAPFGSGIFALDSTIHEHMDYVTNIDNTELLEPLCNPSIIGYRFANSEVYDGGYDAVSFTLDPASNVALLEQLRRIGSPRNIAWESTGGSTYMPVNLEGVKYNYSFKVNDEDVINPDTGDIYFDLWDRPVFDTLIDAVLSHGVVLSLDAYHTEYPYYTLNFAILYVYDLFGEAEAHVNDVYKLSITQHRIDGLVIKHPVDLPWDARHIIVKTDNGDSTTFTSWVYDPLDLTMLYQ